MWQELMKTPEAAWTSGKRDRGVRSEKKHYLCFDLSKWHKRLSHVNGQKLSILSPVKAAFSKIVKLVLFFFIIFCENCEAARYLKHKRLHRKRVQIENRLKLL